MLLRRSSLMTNRFMGVELGNEALRFCAVPLCVQSWLSSIPACLTSEYCKIDSVTHEITLSFT
jgi:hypothetical protein